MIKKEFQKIWLYGSVIVVRSKTIVHAVLMNSIGKKTGKAHNACVSANSGVLRVYVCSV